MASIYRREKHRVNRMYCNVVQKRVFVATLTCRQIPVSLKHIYVFVVVLGSIFNTIIKDRNTRV